MIFGETTSFLPKFLMDAWFWSLYEESPNTSKWPEIKGIKQSVCKTKMPLKRFFHPLHEKNKIYSLSG